MVLLAGTFTSKSKRRSRRHEPLSRSMRGDLSKARCGSRDWQSGRRDSASISWNAAFGRNQTMNATHHQIDVRAISLNW